jgi:zinc transport system substrate-binding protein
MLSRFTTFLVAIVMAFPVSALEILTSIKPLQLIAIEITDGVTEPKALLPANVSPHDYALRVSDVKSIRSADLVVWFGSDLESFMASLVSNSKHLLTLSEEKSIKLRKFDEVVSHEGHDHGSYDSHIWLGPDQALQYAQSLAAKLSEIDAANADTYQKNVDIFKVKLHEKTKQIEQQLSSITDDGYYVFHDAYGYFEDFFGLNNLGYFTVSPERKPGAKTLINIRTTLKEQNVKCVFSEPQYTPAVIDSTIRGTQTKVGVLDPLATDIDAEKGSYFAFLDSITHSFSGCLK